MRLQRLQVPLLQGRQVHQAGRSRACTSARQVTGRQQPCTPCNRGAGSNEPAPTICWAEFSCGLVRQCVSLRRGVFGRRLGDTPVIVPFYLVSLGLAGGLVGVWARRMLAAAGLVSGFHSGLLTVAAVALAYVGLELAFMALVRMLKPTRSPLPILWDMVAQAAALVLVPYLLHIAVPWPWAVLVKYEPIIYLAAFAVPHTFLKLVVFFGALQSRPASPLPALGYFAAAAAALFGAFAAQQQLATAALRNTTVPAGPETAVRAGSGWTQARDLREGLAAHMPIAEPRTKGDLVLYFAQPEDDPARLDTVFVTLAFSGAGSTTFEGQTALADGQWTEFRVSAEALPDKCDAVDVLWSARPGQEWLAKAGLRPATATDRHLAVSGPWFIDRPGAAKKKSVIVIALDGLRAESMSLYGYSRETTPALKARASSMAVFEQAYTPAPETPAACMSLLTGVNPLRHGHFEGQVPAPESKAPETLAGLFRAVGYHTAAFTDGRGVDGEDMVQGSGFEKGFLLFDDAAPMDAPAPAPGSSAPPKALPGSAAGTLAKAGDWIQAHPGDPWFVFVRLRELRAPQRLDRYGEGFLGKGRATNAVDLYDTVLLDLDRRLDAFLERLDALPGGEDAVVVITSPWGPDFAAPGGVMQKGVLQSGLSEAALRVPLLIRIPGQAGRNRKVPVTLCDVAPTVLSQCGQAAVSGLDGMDLARQTEFRDCVSMRGNPVALSVRSGRWRFGWQSGLDPFTLQRTGTEAVLEFTDVPLFQNSRTAQNNLGKEPELAQQLRRSLSDYLEKGRAATAPQPALK